MHEHDRLYAVIGFCSIFACPCTLLSQEMTAGHCVREIFYAISYASGSSTTVPEMSHFD